MAFPRSDSYLSHPRRGVLIADEGERDESLSVGRPYWSSQQWQLLASVGAYQCKADQDDKEQIDTEDDDNGIGKDKQKEENIQNSDSENEYNDEY